MLAALPADVRAELGEHVLPVRWYPIHVVSALHVAVRDELGQGRWTESHRLGREAGRIDFTSIYRVLLRAVQYETVLERIRTAWAHYNSQGETRWTIHGPGSATGFIWGVEGFNQGQWHSIAGRAEKLLLLAGAQSAEIEVCDPTETSVRLEVLYLE